MISNSRIQTTLLSFLFKNFNIIKGNFTLYRTGVITEYIRRQNTPIKERKNRENTRHQILAVHGYGKA
jgi:hypothetical protein